MSSKQLTIRRINFLQKIKKVFRDGLPYSTPERSKEARGNAITQPQYKGMGLRLSIGISPCLFTVFRGGV